MRAELPLQEHHRHLAPAHEPPVDVVHDYPDVISEGLSEPPPLLLDPEGETDEQTTLFDAPRPEGAYVLPDRAVLRTSPAMAKGVSAAMRVLPYL